MMEVIESQAVNLDFVARVVLLLLFQQKQP